MSVTAGIRFFEQQISVIQIEKIVAKSRTRVYILLRLATLKFVAWQVEHAVKIRGTTTLFIFYENVVFPARLDILIFLPILG